MVEVVNSTSAIVKNSLITAFTLVAAFTWRDVIINFIDKFFPRSQLFYQFIAAVVTTFLVIIAIIVVLKTESEAEYVIAKLKKKEKIKE